jgi:hypothetical protein
MEERALPGKLESRRKYVSFPPSLKCSISHHLPPISSLSLQVFYQELLVVTFSRLRPRFTSGLFPFGVPTKTLYAFLFSPMGATRPVNPVLLDTIVITVLLFSGVNFTMRS